jgi:hypothetical protein
MRVSDDKRALIPPLNTTLPVVILPSRDVRCFEIDISLPGVQNLLRIVAEAQRAIDANERSLRAA